MGNATITRGTDYVALAAALSAELNVCPVCVGTGREWISGRNGRMHTVRCSCQA